MKSEVTSTCFDEGTTFWCIRSSSCKAYSTPFFFNKTHSTWHAINPSPVQWCHWNKANWNYLLRRNIKWNCAKIHFLVGVHTRHDEEQTRTLGTSRSKATQSEHNRSLVLLNNLWVKKKSFQSFNIISNTGFHKTQSVLLNSPLKWRIALPSPSRREIEAWSQEPELMRQRWEWRHKVQDLQHPLKKTENTKVSP